MKDQSKLMATKALLYGGVSLVLIAYFLRKYGFETGSWMVGALLYCGCLFLVFPALAQLRLQRTAAALHWLDWVRLSYIPAFALCAMLFASWIPLAKITVLGIAVSVFSAVMALRRGRKQT